MNAIPEHEEDGRPSSSSARFVNSGPHPPPPPPPPDYGGGGAWRDNLDDSRNQPGGGMTS